MSPLTRDGALRVRADPRDAREPIPGLPLSNRPRGPDGRAPLAQRALSEREERIKELSMRKTHVFVASALVAALALPIPSQGQAGPAPKPKFDAEKCYGISKAGKNDCQ